MQVTVLKVSAVRGVSCCRVVQVELLHEQALAQKLNCSYQAFDSVLERMFV